MNINIYMWVASGPLWRLVSGQKQLGAAVWSFWPAPAETSCRGRSCSGGHRQRLFLFLLLLVFWGDYFLFGVVTFQGLVT